MLTLLLKRPMCVLSVILLLGTTVSSAEAADFAGRWKGSWTTHSSDGGRAHHGSLRMRLTPVAPGTYRGLFAGRFAVVIPYVYRATVYQHGSTLTSTKRLGPLGSYHMQLAPTPGGLSGIWSAAGETGAIRLQPR